jgi:cytidyltransferase-like protein
MKEIFQAASNGELKGTEKTDGQNLQLSYDIQTSTARAARNKGNIKSGGMDAAGLAAKFGGRGALESAFNDAFAAFEEAVGRMSIEEREEIFGPNTNIYYNAEVQDPRAANLINYDLPTLTIHRVGHNEYDRETGSATGRDVNKNARKLAAALERVQGEREEGRFHVQMNAIRRLEALSDDTAANLATARLEKVLSDAGISDNQTVGEYMVSRVETAIDAQVSLSDETKINLIKYMFKERNEEGQLLANKRTVFQNIPAEDAGTRGAIQKVIVGARGIMTQAIAPVEEIVHDFSVEMLRGLHSAFILDNEAEVVRLRGETQRAIQAIEGSDSEEAMEILAKQMGKLKDVEGVSTAAEGFVFDYEDVTYKFTGNFAPMNQLLGLFKYGRGNVPPLQKLDEEEVEVVDSQRTVALVPGAFKPPHRGHLEMVQHYAEMADRVVIMVSPLARKTPSGKQVGFEASKAIWEIYLRDAGLADKVDVIRAPVNSPVLATYQFVENKDDSPELAQPGDRIIPGCSTKGGDEVRFKNKANFEKYARKGVQIADPIECAFAASGDALSASDFRAALDSASAGLDRFVPDGTDPQEVLATLGVKADSMTEALMRLVEKAMDETSSMAAGDVAGGAGRTGAGRREDDEPSLIREEEPIDEDEEVIEEVLNYLVGKGAVL